MPSNFVSDMTAERTPDIFKPLLGHRAHDFFPRPENPEHDEDLTRLGFMGAHVLGVWLDDALSRKRRSVEILRAYAIGKDRLIPHILEGLEFVGEMDTADRASNGLREAALWDNRENLRESKFGIVLTEAFNNPLFSHHNHEHDRRVELIMESMMLNIGELRHGILVDNDGGHRTDTIFPWIDSSLLYAYWHDVDQLLTLQRNAMEKRTEETKLPPKKGHALAAAVMMLALHKRYRFERKVDTHRAWQKCAGAAAMIMMHEPPEQLTTRLGAKELAYKNSVDGRRLLLHGKQLQDAYEQNRLDVFSLTPSQLLELLRRMKIKEGFIKDGNLKSYGLHPFFEEEYAAELEVLANNHDPLIRKMTAGSRASFDMAAETAVRADVVDMIAPPVESILRTFSTERKEKRPFLRRNSRDELLEQILHGPGDLPSDEDSDLRRILWEYAHVDLISADTVIVKNRYVQELNRDNAIMGLIAFADIGQQILRGEYAAFDHIYDQRIRMLGSKILRRAFGSVYSTLFQLAHKNMTGYTNQIRRELVKKGKIELAEQYNEMVERLRQEKRTITEGLQMKENIEGSSNDLHFFEDLVNEVLRRVCAQYGLEVKDIHDKKLAKYRKRLKKGLYPASIPYDTWDSLGKWPPSTLVASIKEIDLQKVHELYQQLMNEAGH